jgi:hypothetical protein
MNKPGLNRRDFQRLSLAALGGLAVGAAAPRLILAAEGVAPQLRSTTVKATTPARAKEDAGKTPARIPARPWGVAPFHCRSRPGVKPESTSKRP